MLAIRYWYQGTHKDQLRLSPAIAFTPIPLRTRAALHRLFDNVSARVITLSHSRRYSSGRQNWGAIASRAMEDDRAQFPFTGPLRKIRETIQHDKHKKWGLVIYRCDYTSDKIWAKFLENTRHELASCLAVLKADDFTRLTRYYDKGR
jgi:hypothetical protein